MFIRWLLSDGRVRAWRAVHRVGWVLGWALAAVCTRGAQEAPGHFLQRWQTEDGLPQNHLTAIVQTRDGYLWLGTYNGLARFDGARFVNFSAPATPGLSSSRVTSLCEDVAGVLWVGHDAGELTRLKDGRFEPVALPTKWPGGAIAAIAPDARNDLWLLHSDGLMVRVRDGATAPAEPGMTAQTPLSLARGPRGSLWRVHGGRMHVIGAMPPGQPLAPPPDAEFIVRACASREGGFWVLGGERVSRWRPGGASQDWGEVPWGGAFATTVMEDRAGRLWVGTLTRGVFVLSPEGNFSQFSRTNGLPNDWVRSLTEDREGTVWIGTGGGGLCAARARRVTMVEAPDGWQGRGTLSLCAAGRDGAMWVSTEGAGLYRWQAGHWTRFGEAEGLTNLFVWSVLEDTQGRLFAATWGGGLFELREGRFTHPAALDGETVPKTALHEAKDGALWVGTQRGLLRMREGKVERFGEELALPDVRALAEMPDGTMWFGMAGGGLGRLRDGRITLHRQAEGLPSDYVWSLLAEEDGTLWIGTFGGGLGRMRHGRIVTIGPRQGLPNTVVSHLIDDGRGQLWMGSYGGIVRVNKEDLHRCADGRAATAAFYVYGRPDGLTALECAEGLKSGSCQTADGRLWFATSKGPAVVDPSLVQTNPLAPPVHIEEVWVDDVLLRPPGPLRLGPGRRRFEFRFTALSFAAPERVRFKYRLEGLEENWVEAGGKRAVSYSFLTPGHYVFHVAACNNDGVWNDQGATIALTVSPHFWQMWWFRAVLVGLAVAAVGGVARGVTRRRFRRRLEKLEHQQAVEKERARIAKDIHDDLGASLTRITLLSQTVRSELDHPDQHEQAAEGLEQIYRTARDLTRAMDEIVWAVNPHHDTLDSLVSYLGGFAQDFLRAADLRCRLDVPMRLPALPVTSEVRHNLFLAFKEALHNLVRHAGATEARVVFTQTPGGFELSIQDNGRGFAATGVAKAQAASANGESLRRASGNGLPNMQKRLADLGGECRVRSRPGEGTVVSFLVPLEKAPAGRAGLS